MKKFKICGTIFCDVEVEVDSEKEAIDRFKKDHSYTHDSGLEMIPEVTSIALVEEDEPKGVVSVYVGHSRIMYFDMDDNELVICLRDKNVGIPTHRLDELWSWILECENYYNETTEVDEMKDLNL